MNGDYDTMNEPTTAPPAPIEPPLTRQLSSVGDPLERKRVGDMTVDKFAGLTFGEYRECVEFAKVMAEARNAIPPYLRNNRGDCLAILTQALRWHLEPYWVAQHSYIAKAEALISYDAAVHAAIVLSCGLLAERPRYSFAGEGEERTCTVSVMVKGESTPLEYTTPPLRVCRPPRNQEGTIKGSPLWVKDPDQQLGYYAIRNWGRRHLPEILGGVYDRDEFDETTQDATPAGAPTPNLLARLPGKMEGAGFARDVVDTTLLGPKGKEKKGEGEREGAAEGEEHGAAREAVGGAGEAQEREKPVEAEGGRPKPAKRASGPRKAAAEPAEPKPEPPPSPKTPKEYAAHVKAWLPTETSVQAVTDRWRKEMKLRNEAGVTEEDRYEMNLLVEARKSELRK